MIDKDAVTVANARLKVAIVAAILAVMTTYLGVSSAFTSKIDERIEMKLARYELADQLRQAESIQSVKLLSQRLDSVEKNLSEKIDEVKTAVKEERSNR